MSFGKRTQNSRVAGASPTTSPAGIWGPPRAGLGSTTCRYPASRLGIDRFIMYKWEGAGWCAVYVAIRMLESNQRKVNKQPINFYDYYNVDDQEAAHALRLLS